MANANNRKQFDRYYTEAEEKKLFKLLKNTDCVFAKRDLAWMQFLRFTGIRIGVLGGKVLKDANKRKAGTDVALTLQEAQEKGNVGKLLGLTVGEAKNAIKTGYLTVRPDITKTNSAGHTYMAKAAKAALTELLKIRKKMGHPENADEQLIIGKKNNGLSIRQFQERFSYWANLAGLAGSPHWMRHTMAKRIIKNSTATDPMGIVQNILDHNSINSTTVYTAPDKEDIALAMEQIC